MLIMVFKGAAFKEYVLPNVDNIDYSVVLDKNLFGLRKDIELHLENKMKTWYIKSGDDYSLSVSELVEDQTELCDEKTIYDVCCRSGVYCLCLSQLLQKRQ